MFALLSEDEQSSLLASLAADAGTSVDDVKAELAWTWEGWLARPSQLEPRDDWLFWLIKAGRGFGKTRVGAEWVRKQVRSYPRVALIGKDAGDMRSVMIEGESGILAVCPRHERPVYLPTRRMLRWPNGAISECRTGEDPEGVRGIQFDRLWADEIAAWQYPQETWDMALLAMRLGDDIRACVTTTPKPIRVVRDLINDADTRVSGGSTHENLDNLAPTFRKVIDRYEGTRLGRQEIYAELLEDEGLAYRYSEKIHVVPAFEIPAGWERFEHMDYGLSAATAWYSTAVDYDGNLIVMDGIYEPGLPSEIAPQVKARRLDSWGSGATVWADPAVFHPGARTKFGRPASVADEFSDEGVALSAANNDRRAGFVRVSELLKLDEHRRFPAFSEFAGQEGSPRLFIIDTPGTLELREQLADAPLEEDGKPLPGEAVDRDWERESGHAHASLRYGMLSRPSPSLEVRQPLDDPRAERWRQVLEKREQARPRIRSRYQV